MTSRHDWSANNPRRYQAHPLYQEPDAPEYAIPAPSRDWRLPAFLVSVLGILAAVAFAYSGVR